MKFFKKLITNALDYLGMKEAFKEGYLNFKLVQDRQKRQKIKFKKYQSINAVLIKNEGLKEKGLGKRAFLLATGPSIKEEELSLLKGEDCFSVSNFYLHKNIDVISPKFHFFMPYHQPLVLEDFITWLRQADEKLPASTNIFLATQTKEMVDKYNLFPKRSVYYLYFDDDLSKNNVDILTPLQTSQTVPVMALTVLLYMGYDKIYLLGCDHNVLKYYNQEVHYFYDKNDELRKSESKKLGWAHNIIVSLECSKRVFVQYESLALIANNKNILITNLSAESWLETFPKNSFKDVISGKSS